MTVEVLTQLLIGVLIGIVSYMIKGRLDFIDKKIDENENRVDQIDREVQRLIGKLNNHGITG